MLIQKKPTFRNTNQHKMKEYIDNGAEILGMEYTRDEVIDLIKSILIGDEDLLNGRSIERMSDDDIIEIGHNHYSITLK